MGSIRGIASEANAQGAWPTCAGLRGAKIQRKALYISPPKAPPALATPLGSIDILP